MGVLKLNDGNGNWLHITTIKGDKGAVFTPSIDNDGVLSWTNNGGETNPASVNIPQLVRDIYVETITDTDPVIVGVDNHRYICGEVDTISITPPQSGIIDVVFTSGNTAATLTIPNTVLLPEWFDATDLDTNAVYEINIADGIYGAVIVWAL